MISLQPGRHLRRATGLFWNRRVWVVDITTEGLYLKAERGRWSGALFLPWAAAVSVAAKMRAVEIRKERAERRKARRSA
jgi:hypothetical protein